MMLFDGQGTLIDTIDQPHSWSAIATCDVQLRQLWVYGERDDEPTLFRISIR